MQANDNIWILKKTHLGIPSIRRCHKAMDIFRSPLSPIPPRSTDTYVHTFAAFSYGWTPLMFVFYWFVNTQAEASW